MLMYVLLYINMYILRIVNFATEFILMKLLITKNQYNYKPIMNSNQTKRKGLFRWMGYAMIAAGCLSSCEGYDLAEEDPSWLGSSIYDYLKDDGNYTNTVKLIDDLGYSAVLAKTGSKTLFVADDDAFQRFYQNNTWGVHNYNELQPAQKKLLLYGSMINNSCQVAYLSSSEGPTEGDCMRRLTATSAYDSVPVLTPDQMPDNPYWKYYHDTRKEMVVMSDITTPPMIHFVEAFLSNKLITNDDCNFLFNYKTQRQPGDANVNGIMMEQQNIKCSNGFVHKMAEVITPLPNMAQCITDNPKTQIYARLLNRFCAPYYAGLDETKEYNRIYKTEIDSLFEKRYFSERSRGGNPLVQTPDKRPVNGTLKFDPGWNQYYATTTSSTSTNVAIQENMGVMLVPTDDKLDAYWEGSVLKKYYCEWDSVPDKVISKLINVNMLGSFVSSVPSKFKNVLNDANDELKIKTTDVDSVVMACNGAVYLTNKVFCPVAYISVTFPALISESMSIFYWGVEQLGYDVYLNSQNSYYSLFIPENGAMLEYIDPCSYGKVSTQLFRFRYDSAATDEEAKVKASIWDYNTETGVVGDSIGEASYSQITNRLEDILNTHIVIGNVEDGNTFYKTKGGSVVRVENGGKKVKGGLQIENGDAIDVVEVFDLKKDGGNGKTYIIDSAPIMTARKSVFDILKEHEEFSAFRELVESSSFLEKKHVIGTDEHGCPTDNISLFNTYHYTVFVPTNAAIEKLQKDGVLPTWAQVDAEKDEELKASMTEQIETFIKYHIQDNAFYIGQGNDGGEYETSAYKVEDGNLSYYKLKTTVSNDGITIIDGTGKTHKVDMSKGLYNLMAREYQYDAGDATRANNIYTSSNAVIHQIDDALWYK